MFGWTHDVTHVSMAGGMLSIKMLEEFPSSNHHQTSWVTVSGNIFLPEVNSNQYLLFRKFLIIKSNILVKIYVCSQAGVLVF